ncbi:MAG: hypothetical protein HY332_21635 [Chloroflexi bacterium]|nr:hypothetical protein [Chloroflexota bacterium]
MQQNEPTTGTPPGAAGRARRWWHQPFRIVQTNLREIDAGLDVERHLDMILDFGANVWEVNTGGIVSFYPTDLPYQHRSAWLAERPSGDLIGDAVAAAHARGVRILSRLDLSKCYPHVFEAHADWFYVGPQGGPQIYAGLYSTCPSGPYYQEKTWEILDEILARYPVDGFFFNMFTFPMSTYAREYYGICQCLNCRRRFREFSGGMALPREEQAGDPAYRAWRRFEAMTRSDLGQRIHTFIQSRRPDAAYFARQHGDVVMLETGSALTSQPLVWPFRSGEQAKEALTSQAEKPRAQCTHIFYDTAYRLGAERPGYVALQMAEQFAHGVNPWPYVTGSIEQPDRKHYATVRRWLRFHREHESSFASLRAAAQVALVVGAPLTGLSRAAGATGDQARRGAYAALVEAHVPFVIVRADELPARQQDGSLGQFRALVLPNVAALDDAQAAVLDRYVRDGGGLVATFDTSLYAAGGEPRQSEAGWTFGLQSLGAARVLRRRERREDVHSAYLRVTRREDLPDLPDTNLVGVARGFLHVEPRLGAVPSFTFIGTSPHGPPEKCYWDPVQETSHPGLLWYTYGRGRTAYFPWPVDALFAEMRLPEYRSLLAGAVERVAAAADSSGGEAAPRWRQVVTDAPPCVEVMLMARPAGGGAHLQVHLVNHSGYRGHSIDEPLPLSNVAVQVRDPRVADATQARALHLGRALPVTPSAAGAQFVLPDLGLYELVEFPVV